MIVVLGYRFGLFCGLGNIITVWASKLVKETARPSERVSWLVLLTTLTLLSCLLEAKCRDENKMSLVRRTY
jgi:hypothetical protein